MLLYKGKVKERGYGTSCMEVEFARGGRGCAGLCLCTGTVADGGCEPSASGTASDPDLSEQRISVAGKS
ncbi:hypothetical protein SDC9_203878 [bioreactor metagenome]|uniref:Uncharacterized protein n=1 Tax=bioreactor metagenome TaxID=1076179 RepID=A0A645IZA4_9ZZZZ